MFYGTDIDRARTRLAEECYSLGTALLDSDAMYRPFPRLITIMLP